MFQGTIHIRRDIAKRYDINTSVILEGKTWHNMTIAKEVCAVYDSIHIVQSIMRTTYSTSGM